MGKNTGKVPIEPKSNLPIIDCHCHVPWNKRHKKGIPYEEQYNQFFEEGGKFLISSSVDWKSLNPLLKFAEGHKNYGLTSGFAPQTVTYTEKKLLESEFTLWVEFLSNNPLKYLGIGEIGLDFHHAKTLEKRTHQINYFRMIISKTKKLNKPYILHVRNAGNNDMDPKNPDHKYNGNEAANDIILEILKEENIESSRVMWHCFSGPNGWGEKLSKAGFYLSVPSSAYGFNRWRKLTGNVPITQLLTETDSPYQPPLKYGAYNSPKNVKYSIASIAHSHSQDQLKVAEQVIENAKKFFNITF
jgi:TatD DNase family protein